MKLNQLHQTSSESLRNLSEYPLLWRFLNSLADARVGAETYQQRQDQAPAANLADGVSEGKQKIYKLLFLLIICSQQAARLCGAHPHYDSTDGPVSTGAYTHKNNPNAKTHAVAAASSAAK